MADWAIDTPSAAVQASSSISNGGGGAGDEISDRTSGKVHTKSTFVSSRLVSGNNNKLLTRASASFLSFLSIFSFPISNAVITGKLKTIYRKAGT